jgi:UDP:flavonoid glycosyltransferase YjiC (YdhE family)
MAVALELKRRGHRPIIASAEYFRDKIVSAGLDFHPVRPNLTPADKDLLRQTMDERHGPEFLLRKVMMPALRDTFADLREAVHGADVLTATDLLYAAPVVADAVGIPWVALTMAPMTFLSTHDPPALSAAPWLVQLARFSRPAYAAIIRLARWSTRDWGTPVYQLRQELGLPRGLEPLFGARANAGALLGLFSPVVGARQPDWPANAQTTGFAFYDRHEPMPPSLREFLDAGDPPIVFTLGSAAVFDPGAFHHHSAEAARRLGRRAVLLVGPDPENVPAADARLAVARYAPFSELFPRAAAVVHQGGIGTTAQVLRAARAMVIVPFSHDQPDNAARMVRLGVARTVRRTAYSAATAAAALDALFADPEHARKAERAAETLRHEDGAARAADVIESVASRDRRPPTTSEAAP